MVLSSLPITHRATVKDEYLDLMGHMNVVWYMHLFDQATWFLFAMMGMDVQYYERNMAGNAALEQHTRYLAELRLSTPVTLRSRVLGRSAKLTHFMHFMVNEESGVLAATTELIGIHLDRAERRSAPMPTAIIAQVDRVIAEHQALEWDAPVCGLMKP